MAMAAATSVEFPIQEFNNPKCEPLEDLKLTVNVDGEGEKMFPAINIHWVKDRPIIDYINPPEKDELGQYPLDAKEDWLERSTIIVNNLEWLLSLNTHCFWSQLIFQEDSLSAVKSFVKEATAFYFSDISRDAYDEDIQKTFTTIEELAFEIFLRLTTNKVSKTEWFGKRAFGNILYDNYIITIPFLMDICICFGKSNHAVISKAVSSVFKYQENYLEDVKGTVEYLTNVLKRIEDQLNCGKVREEEPIKLSQRPASQNVLNRETLSSLVICLLDTIYGFTSFIDICKPAARIYHKQNFEIILADFYENFVPVMCHQIELVCEREKTSGIYCDLKYKMNLARWELCNGVHLLLSSCINKILKHKKKLIEADIKRLADEYTTVLSDCLAYRLFMSDYQHAFPVEHDRDLLAQVCPEIDVCDSVFESVMSCLNYQTASSNQVKLTASYSNQDSGHASTSYENQASSSVIASVNEATGVDLKSLVTEIKDIFPHLQDQFVQKCLERFKYDSAAVINAVLEDALSDVPIGLDPEMQFLTFSVNDTKESNGLPERLHVFDSDDFDIMKRDDVDTSKMHIGKRGAEHKGSNDILDDISYVNQMRDMHLSTVESHENSLYEDEYDDTYDEAGTEVGHEEETKRKLFTVPRVLQRRVFLPEVAGKEVASSLPEEEESSEETDVEDKLKVEHFVGNPEKLRAKREQHGQDQYTGRRNEPSGSQRDVVGKSKGQSQDKQVKDNRQHKNVYKSRSGNHSRRAMSSTKRN